MKAPKHLERETARWFEQVVKDYELSGHHIRLLTLASESWDRCQQARKILAKQGMTYIDRWDQPRARPEVSIERDSRIAFARLLRELNLDVEEPPESPRPQALRY